MAHTAGGEGQAFKRQGMEVTSLSTLVGAHPDALRSIYERGSPADPESLGDAPRGRVLAIGDNARAFMLMRPLLQTLATDALPWKGKVFDHGGNSGQNVVFSRRAFRFHAEVEPSYLDGKPSLLLRYGDPAYKNPRLLRAVVDELREVGPGVAIGPALRVAKDGSPDLLLWFGLENESARAQ